ncbi:protein Nazo-like [Prorops nasuta]|uniref:protein Nazo-like n=1 Tax=Prorops nasuta TaxID=863751 RepID=UPI0034CDCA0F
MALSNNEILYEVIKLPALNKLKVTVQSSVTSGIIVGASTMLSGLALGPIGFALGGIISSCTASALSYGQFESLPDIIMKDLTQEQRNRLAASVKAKVAQYINMGTIRKIGDLLLQIQNNEMLVAILVQHVGSFLRSELGREIMNYS